MWNNRQKYKYTGKDYTSFQEIFKHTPRKLSKNCDFSYQLKQLTFQLNLNINVLGLKPTRKLSFVRCENNVHTKKCVIPYYLFNNPICKLVNTKAPSASFTFLYYKTNIYFVFNDSHFTPILINHKPCNYLDFNGTVVTKYHIERILQNLPVKFPFGIVVYSSFTFTYKYASKQIERNAIGMHTGQEPYLHIFLTPHLINKSFCLSRIELPFNPTFSKQNCYSYSHEMEGTNSIKKATKNKENLLNQHFCVCDHECSERIFSTGSNNFESLGI